MALDTPDAPRGGGADPEVLAGTLLSRAAASWPDRTALICELPDGVHRSSYAELDAEAWRVAAALLRDGSPGRRVAILSGNRPEYPAVYFGSSRAGTVLVNVPVRATARELRYILEQTGATHLFHDPESAERVDEAIVALAPLPRVIGLGAPFRGFLEGADPKAVSFPGGDPDGPYCMTYTGGTTGLPKGVLVSQRARCSGLPAAAAALGLVDGDVVACVTPLCHIAGLMVWLQLAVATGSTSVLLPRWNAEAFVEQVERHGIRAALVVPTQLADVLSAPGFSPERLSSLERLVHVGAPMPRALLSRALRTLPWVEPIANYGQSEIGPATVLRGHEMKGREQSVGRALPGFALSVLDGNGRPVPPGQLGEVCSRGSNALLEYFQEPGQTRELLRYGDGWVATGDLGIMDAEGYITLVDRAKDVIISGGDNVYPFEIENAIQRHPAVAECAVFAIPDERLGEVPAAQVVLKPGARATAEELIELALRHVARHKRPRRVDFVDALPRTAIGKIRKAEIRKRYWDLAEDAEP
jgi:acyl-CoA synthetase (AMP-forming)/AMP-acid ligase II